MCIFYSGCTKCNSKWLLEYNCDHTKKSLVCVTHKKTSRKKFHARIFFLGVYLRSCSTKRKRECSWSNGDSLLCEAKAICGTSSLRMTILAKTKKFGKKKHNNDNNKLDKINKTTNPSKIGAICT